MQHKQKIKLARKMRSASELVQGVSVFDTKLWNARKEKIRQRVIRIQKGEHERAIARKLKAAEEY